MSKSASGEIVLSLKCPDRVGIVYAVAGHLSERGINILESQQFSDQSTGQFFMRVQAAVPKIVPIEELREDFTPLAEQFGMSWVLFDSNERPKILVLVSRLGHCLNDLLYRHRIGALSADIAAVVSNHKDFEALSHSYGIPFHYLPVSAETKTEQEANLLRLVDELEIDLVVLARYMQILSDATANRLAGRAINIHHSFLPSFKGARPYHQAYERGVKLIGATAHYVTSELDEGPIIEQEVARVDHSHLPDELIGIGRDIECAALARAVQWHLEHRVIINGSKTVIFR